MADEEETWGGSVRRRRDELGLSQSALARLSGVSRGTLRNVELGLVHRVNRRILEAIEGALSAGPHPTPAPTGQADERVTLGYSYPPTAHSAVRQLAVSAEIVLMEHLDVLTGDEVDANLVELLLALVALPDEVRGPTAPVLLEIAEEVRRG